MMGGDCCGWNWKCVYDSTNFHSITGKVGFSCVIYLYRWMICRKGRGGNSRIWWSFNNYSTRTCWLGIGMGWKQQILFIDLYCSCGRRIYQKATQYAGLGSEAHLQEKEKEKEKHTQYKLHQDRNYTNYRHNRRNVRQSW